MLTSITSIANLNEELKTNILNSKKRGYDQSQLFGPENEYTLKGLLAGLQSFTVDIAFLVKNENYFIRVSTHVERLNIINYLTNINSYLLNNTFSNLPDQIDNLKCILNHYNLRVRKDHFAEFHNSIDILKRTAVELDDQLVAIRQSKENAEDLVQSISTANETFKQTLEEYEVNISTQDRRLKTLENSITISESVLSQIEGLKDSADENLKTIQNNESIFKNFIDKILERELELDKQAKKTSDYEKDLTKYSEERKSIIEESKELIKSAKDALQYKTAEGMSAAFQTKEEASSAWTLTSFWLTASIIMLCGAVAIGVWQLYTQDHNIYQIIGRISMISLIIISATFCAKQYTKQKNLIEDYAYKSVLSKSFIGFAEEIKKHNDQDAYNQFILMALKEILQDPLRTREDIKAPKINLNNKTIEELSGIISAVAKLKSGS